MYTDIILPSLRPRVNNKITIACCRPAYISPSPCPSGSDYTFCELYFLPVCIFPGKIHNLSTGDDGMKKGTWKTYAVWILAAEAVGALSGWLSSGGMKLYSEVIRQPPLSPPAFLFPIVWGILYALMGFGAARIWLSPPSPARSRGLNIYVAQLVVNFFWSLIFFNAQAFGFALLWLILLWTLVLWMIVEFRQVDKPAGNIQIPYLIWLTFAAYLNLGVWYLN